MMRWHSSGQSCIKPSMAFPSFSWRMVLSENRCHPIIRGCFSGPCADFLGRRPSPAGYKVSRAWRPAQALRRNAAIAAPRFAAMRLLIALSALLGSWLRPRRAPSLSRCRARARRSGPSRTASPRPSPGSISTRPRSPTSRPIATGGSPALAEAEPMPRLIGPGDLRRRRHGRAQGRAACRQQPRRSQSAGHAATAAWRSRSPPGCATRRRRASPSSARRSAGNRDTYDYYECRARNRSPAPRSASTPMATRSTCAPCISPTAAASN